MIKMIVPMLISLIFLTACEEKRSVAKVENKAPNYSLPNLKNQLFSSQELEGKVRLIVFWATWCKPCVEEVPVLNDLYEYYQDKDFVIHAISVDRVSDSAKIPLFVEKYNLKYPVLKGSPALQSEFRSDKVPTTYLLNQSGEYVRKWNGPQPSHVFIREIDRLLKK